LKDRVIAQLKADILEQNREFKVKQTEREFKEFYELKLKKLEEEVRRDELNFRYQEGQERAALKDIRL
jgi:hypothetical protein